MSSPGWHQFSVSAENMTLLADTGDFFQLVGGAIAWRLLEVIVWQRGSTTLVVDTLRLNRGTAGSGGSALTELEYGTSGPAPTVAALSLPTTDVGAVDWTYRRGFNLLQEQVTLPIPKLQVPFKIADDLGIATELATAHTGVGVQVSWEEFTGS